MSSRHRNRSRAASSCSVGTWIGVSAPARYNRASWPASRRSVLTRSHLFALKQNLELFDTYQRQLTACDAAIEGHLQTLATKAAAAADPLPAPRSSAKPRRNEPRFDIRNPLHQLAGVDLTQLDAIGPYSALRLL